MTRPPPIFRRLTTAAAGLALAGGAVLLAQMMPDAPIEHFRLPVFAESGFKAWELRGTRGDYDKANERALVDGLELVVFSGDEAMRVETRIRSPRALIRFTESRADGESALFVTGPGYEIQGRDWTWQGLERKIIVRQAVRVSFAGKLDILE